MGGEEEEDMDLEDTAGAGLEEVAPTGPTEAVMDQVEAAMDLATEGGAYQWVQWQPEQALV